MNPIIRRELLELLRTRKALAAQVGLAAVCALLVLVRWPTGGVSDLNGARSLQVLRVFGYGLLAGLLFIVPAFPATAIVREKIRGTLALLLNTPMSAASIYLGKFLAVLGFAGMLMLMTLPAAAACHALGGAASRGGVLWLYVVLLAATVQLAAVGLLISAFAESVDGALRATYGAVFFIALAPMVPAWLLQGDVGLAADFAGWLRCLSPVPAVMEVLGHGGVGTHGLGSSRGAVPRFLLIAVIVAGVSGAITILKLRSAPLDRARPAGTMTQDRSLLTRILRRIVFLVDPQRRSGLMGWWVNPVMVKEFRTRKFGRSHWTLRLIALCAVLSLALSLLAVSEALGWGPDVIGGALVILQSALLILFAPSLAAGLISSERESGSWTLLRTTPLSAGRILRGKLMSVAWPLVLLMGATLPGYLVMMSVTPELSAQIVRVVITLGLTAVFAILVSAAASSLLHTTAAATAAAYLALVAVCLIPLLAALARDAPLGRSTVESLLTISPVAAALDASDWPPLMEYDLVPGNWWLIGAASVALLVLLALRTRRLYQPE